MKAKKFEKGCQVFGEKCPLKGREENVRETKP